MRRRPPSDPRLLQVARDLFDELAPMDADARAAFLLDRCAGRPELAALLGELLDSHDAVDQSTLLDAGHLLIPAIAEQTRLKPGETVGHWCVLEPIGGGGMGAMYRVARSDDTVDQIAALKLVRRELLDEEMRLRFHRERQIVADLDHPHIARLIDAGDHGDTPYYVMEYVPGLHITEYCDHKSLAIRDRLALFLDVLGAIAYAHHRLIVHRDLKPANVLVTDDGVAKVVDFGIAAPLTKPDQASHAETRALSPYNAAPEQFSENPVTTACDVYGLGTLLYELLCGLKPLEFGRNSLDAIKRVVTEQLPPPPSWRLMAASDHDSVSAHRLAAVRGQAGVDRLARTLRGDLDAICLHALRKMPEERYPSAESFAADINASLVHRPAAARDPGWLGRCGKLLQRNRAAAALGALAGVTVVAFVISLWVHSLRLGQERDQARLERQRAEQVTEFLVETFRSADPTETLGETLTARAVLERGARRLQTELNDQPELRAELTNTIVDVLLTLGLFPQAEALLENADSGPLSPARELSRLRLQARLLHALARYDEARVVIERAIRQSSPPLDRASAMTIQGNILGSLDRREDALRVHRQAYAIRLETLGLGHRDTWRSLREVASATAALGRSEEALALINQLLPELREVFPRGHPELATTLQVAAYLERRLRNYPRALEHALAAETIYREVYGPDHLVVASVLNSIANIERQLDDYQAAADRYRDSLAIYLKHYGPDHPRVAMLSYNLGILLHRYLGRTEAARPHLAKAVDTGSRHWGSDHTNANLFRLGYATLLTDLEELEEAERLLRQALHAFEQINAPRGLNLAMARAELASVLARTGRPDQARELLELSLPVMLEVFGRDDIDVRRAVRVQESLAAADP